MNEDVKLSEEQWTAIISYLMLQQNHWSPIFVVSPHLCTKKEMKAMSSVNRNISGTFSATFSRFAPVPSKLSTTSLHPGLGSCLLPPTTAASSHCALLHFLSRLQHCFLHVALHTGNLEALHWLSPPASHVCFPPLCSPDEKGDARTEPPYSHCRSDIPR